MKGGKKNTGMGGGPKVRTPAEQLKRVSKGEPQSGSGSDTAPYSAAHKGKKK